MIFPLKTFTLKLCFGKTYGFQPWKIPTHANEVCILEWSGPMMWELKFHKKENPCHSIFFLYHSSYSLLLKSSIQRWFRGWNKVIWYLNGFYDKLYFSGHVTTCDCTTSQETIWINVFQTWMVQRRNLEHYINISRWTSSFPFLS